MTDFDRAFDDLIAFEGGYVWDPRDPGGETRWGISKRAYPHVDIRNLTRDQARQIYYRDYWQRARCDQLPPGVAFDVFDAAVNSGIGQAIRWLQRAVGVADDGIVGPLTIAAVRALPPAVVQARMSGHRLQFMTDLSTWSAFGKGWARRVAINLKNVGVPA